MNRYFKSSNSYIYIINLFITIISNMRLKYLKNNIASLNFTSDMSLIFINPKMIIIIKLYSVIN